MYTFPKKEHLCGDKNIENLHQNGKSFLVYPLRVVYLTVENEEVPVRVVVSVSKKKFKRAVKRNRIKRLMRESYRLNKTEFVSYAKENQLKVHVAFQYIANELVTFDTVNEKMQIVLKRLIQNTISSDENSEKSC